MYTSALSSGPCSRNSGFGDLAGLQERCKREVGHDESKRATQADAENAPGLAIKLADRAVRGWQHGNCQQEERECNQLVPQNVQRLENTGQHMLDQLFSEG